ncbi:MAG: outer membrane beta-barrel protein, partial [Bacteroidota bacterium]
MKFFIALCMAISSIAMYAQPSADYNVKTGSVSGRVIDSLLTEPLPYVNVIIKDQAGNTITGAITADDGTFLIKKIPEGNIIVEISYMGYQLVSKPLVLGKNNYKIELGDVMLIESTEGLDEVLVVAEVSTIQQKVDRKVINIGKDLTTAGPTAADIFNNIPSINVDQQTGQISMRGNQNVQVMVDGKLTNIAPEQLLRQIPSTSIKQIELITNPSAKYNPDGMSGIINIILYKNVNVGFNGNINVGLGYEIEPKFNSSIDMNYRNGKLNFFGNYGNNISDNATEGIISQPEVNTSQTFDFLDSQQSHLYKLGVDYYINEKNTVSFFTNQNIFDGKTLGVTEIFFQTVNEDGQIQTLSNVSDNTTSQYNLDYKLEFGREGQNIELEVDYNLFDNSIETQNIFQGEGVRPNFDEFTDVERDRTTINLDYVIPLSESAKLEAGAQARIFNNTIDYSSDGRVLSEEGNYIPTSTFYDYSRDIYSIYASYGKTLEKWTYQIGLRAETVDVETLATETDLTTGEVTNTPFTNDYIGIYPSVFLTYNPSEKNGYQFSYSRRVDRPGVGQVNPIPEWNTPLISQFGNQELLPQFTNSLEVNYTRQFEKGSLTAGVFYRMIEDEISQAVLIDRANLGTGRIILTWDNFDTTSAYGLELSGNYELTKWWNFNASFDLYAQTQKGFAENLDPTIENPTENDIIVDEVEVDNVIYNIRMFNNFKVSEKVSFSLFGLYRGRNVG